jgi:Rrf2 family cysteine metabolism transcriptional repressor
MKISQKGLYALQAMMMLARHHHQGAIKIRDIAYEEVLPEKFLELILLELKNARMVESVRGAKGGYQLRRDPAEIHLSEIIRLIDGPLAPFGDAEQLRELIDRDLPHRALYKIFLDIRDAAARILDTATLADLIVDPNPRAGKGGKRQQKKQKNQPASILPMVVGGAKGD